MCVCVCVCVCVLWLHMCVCECAVTTIPLMKFRTTRKSHPHTCGSSAMLVGMQVLLTCTPTFSLRQNYPYICCQWGQRSQTLSIAVIPILELGGRHSVVCDGLVHSFPNMQAQRANTLFGVIGSVVRTICLDTHLTPTAGPAPRSASRPRALL